MNILVTIEKGEYLCISDGNEFNTWDIYIQIKDVPKLLETLKKDVSSGSTWFPPIKGASIFTTIEVVSRVGHVRFDQGSAELIVHRHDLDQLIRDIEHMLEVAEKVNSAPKVIDCKIKDTSITVKGEDVVIEQNKWSTSENAQSIVIPLMYLPTFIDDIKEVSGLE